MERALQAVNKGDLCRHCSPAFGTRTEHSRFLVDLCTGAEQVLTRTEILLRHTKGEVNDKEARTNHWAVLTKKGNNSVIRQERDPSDVDDSKNQTVLDPRNSKNVVQSSECFLSNPPPKKS